MLIFLLSILPSFTPRKQHLELTEEDIEYE
jgi:hypothetical protein